MTVGILSMLDVLTNVSMEKVLKELSLSDSVKNALLLTNPDEKISLTYQLILDCERGNWKQVAVIAEKFKIPVSLVAQVHHEAIKWVMQFSGSVVKKISNA